MSDNEIIEALRPFAHYWKVMRSMGGTTPRTGPVWGCHSKAGDAEITCEDLARAAEIVDREPPASEKP